MSSELPSIDPDKYVEEQIAQAKSPSRVTSLQNIRAVCNELIRLGAKMDLAKVAARCKELHGGPAESSIRNAPELKQAVDLYIIKWRGGKSATRQKVRETSLEDALARIPDQQVVARLRLMIAQNTTLMRDNENLRAAFKKIDPVAGIAPDGSLLPAPSKLNSGTLAVSAGPTFTEQEKASVAVFLHEMGSKLDFIEDSANGALKAKNGRTVARPGFLSALKKICGW